MFEEGAKHVGVYEAMDYLSTADLAKLQRSPDEECDDAVAEICRSYRAATGGLVPEPDDPTPKASRILGMYASKFLLRAARDGDVISLNHALVCLQVSNLVEIDFPEAVRILDRYIVLSGTIKAETALVDAAARLAVSRDLQAAIKRRITRSK